jgi:CRISPR-associated endonuclease/helicase Cas3
MRWEGNTLYSGKLIETYDEFITKNNLQDRKAIRETIETLEEGHNVILKAPTGYGKTTLTKVLANATIHGQYFDRVIHVLPLRAIVQDLYNKLKKDSESGVIKTKSIAAQDMDYSDSPFFMKKVTVTTLDTFVLNLFKLPAVEVKNVFKNYGSHYELSRGMIYSSIVIFDEFHLLGEEGRPLTVGLASIKSLTDAGVPVVVMSATIDKNLEDLIKKYGRDFKVVEDPNFAIKREITVRKISTQEVLDDAVNQFKKGKRVLVVFNTRAEAVEFYKKVKAEGVNPVLIHSKFNKNDRVEIVKRIVEEGARFVISTQVIEAGVDTSFDVLITEASPASNLIQRAGRVARYGGVGEVHVFPFSGKVYDKREVESVWNSIKDGGDLPKLAEREYEVDYALLGDLTTIDYSVFANHETTKKLYETVCNLVRDTAIILGFPVNNFSIDYAVPLTEQEALRELKQNGVIKNGEVSKDVEVKGECLQLKFLKEGIDGVVIRGYDKEIGGIL